MKRFLTHIMKLCWDNSARSKANLKRFEKEQGEATVLNSSHRWRGVGAKGVGRFEFPSGDKGWNAKLVVSACPAVGAEGEWGGEGLEDVSSQTSKMESDSLLHIQTKTEESRNIIFSQLQKRHHSLGIWQLHQAKLLGSFPLDRLLHLYSEWFNGLLLPKPVTQR